MSDDEVLAGVLRRMIEADGYANWGLGWDDKYELCIDKTIKISADENAAIERIGAPTFWERPPTTQTPPPSP